jgi:hypothetical protein
MSTTGTVDHSIIQIIQTGHEVQRHIESLIPYINIESIPAGDGWSKVECVYDGSKILDEIREEFKKKFTRSPEVVVKDLFRNTFADYLMYCRLPISLTRSSQPLSIPRNHTSYPELCN